jgi:hypothetical protein
VHPGRVHTPTLGGCAAVFTEAAPEQKSGDGVERDEIALVVVAVLETVIVEGFGKDRLHLITRDIGGDSPHVGPGIRIRRAELALVEIAERILGRAGGVLAGAVGVEEDGPGIDRQATGCRRPARLAENIALARERAEGRLHETLVVEPRLRGKKCAPRSCRTTRCTGLRGKTSRAAW